MSISTTLGRIISHAAPNPSDACNACERTGLPILPLRAAYAPSPGQTYRRQPTASTEPATLRMRLDQPRILRQGYLYVLLDEVQWQAYQITPEGALRQFRPFQVPRDEPSPLSPSCVNRDHDVTASFINIDTETFSTAWIAIANDPWPESVLNQYLCGRAADGADPKDRFYKLDLKSARDNPASVGIAMTENNLGLDSVLEYAEVNAGDFESVHGFYSRNHRLVATKGHIRTIIQREKLQNGVLALVLPDPIGWVQECNAHRVSLFREMQEWRAEPQRRFEFFTSQALLGIKELHAAWASAEAEEEAKAAEAACRKPNFNPIAAGAGLLEVHIPGDAERRAKIKQAEAKERLEKRYDESARATFEKTYLAAQDNWQKAIDRVGELYARECQSRPFQLAAQYDYSATSWRSVEGFIRMLGLCLVGGPTEVISKDDEQLGATQRLWKAQLEDPKSLLYQALLAKDMALLTQLQTALMVNDLGKVYDTIKNVIGTEEGKNLMVAPVREAVGQMLAGMASASNALGKQLSSQTYARVGHVHSAAFLRYAGQHVTQIIVSLKLGEYLSLPNEALQERTDQFLAHIDQKFRKPAERKIRAMVVSGAIAIAVPGNHGKIVDVMMWSLESAEALQERLKALRQAASETVAQAIRTVSVGAATLQTGAVDLVGKFAIGAEEAKAIARGALQKMRNVAISSAPAGADLLLGLGSLWFQQDSLRRNYATFLTTSESGSAEALAAVWSSSIGVMGAGVEVAGVGIRILRPDLKITVRTGGRVRAVSLGTRVAQYGGAVTAVAAIADGVQYSLAQIRTSTQGDALAQRLYGTAKLLAIGAAGFGAIGALAINATMFGPLGIALVLGLAAFGIATLAKQAESSPLELWARHSRWGIPEKHRRWTADLDFDTAVGALNAAVLGMTAELAVETRFDWRGRTLDTSAGEVSWDGSSIPAANFIEYRISMPGYEPLASRYSWNLKIYRIGEGNGREIASGHSGSPPSPVLPSPDQKNLDWYPKTTMPEVSHDEASKALLIHGSIALRAGDSIDAMSVQVSYWPDATDIAGCAWLEIREDKVDSSRND